MKVLYAIQGTGNGHLARAREIVPYLYQLAEVDLLISGQHAEVQIPFPVRYHFKGLGFIFGKSGGVDLLKTFARNNTRRLYKEIKNLNLAEYDLVINDFEPVSAWAARVQGVPCVSLSHQSAVLSPHAPRPEKSDLMGRTILQRYAPTQAQYGFHFKRYDAGIYTPVIRREVRQIQPRNEGHFTVYLPAYDDERIINVLSRLKGVPFQVFSKHSKQAYREGDVRIFPIENEAFLKSMAGCEGILCGAGFETPAEALFLKKKVMAIPMKNQYEQQCNAAALLDLGVPVIKKLRKKRLPELNDWIFGTTPPPAVDYPDETREILEHVLKTHLPAPSPLFV